MLEKTNQIDVHDLPIDAVADALDSRQPAPSPVAPTKEGSDVFISYAREDRREADRLARELQRRGWTVWWDRRILFGRLFSNVIERELDAARCVVVLWSRRSVDSGWVRFEAMEGLNRGVLIPIRLEKSRVPLRFQELQTADLFGEERDKQFEECVKAIASIVPPGTVPAADEFDSLLAGDTRADRGFFPVIRSAARIGALTLLAVTAAALIAAAFSPKLIDRAFDVFREPSPAIVIRPHRIRPVVPPLAVPEMRVRQGTRLIQDPDHNPVEYRGAVEIQVPSNGIVRVSVGLQRFVEGCVRVTDESGKRYQEWGTAAHHNYDTELTLTPGRTFYVSSWHKDVADKGDALPWHPSVQVLKQSNGSAKLTVFRPSSADVVDALIDVNVIGRNAGLDQGAAGQIQ